ncbi:MAG: FKBP-type peptidyl-prolyl cis-trans isomerase [Chitinophagaceae bacterium]
MKNLLLPVFSILVSIFSNATDRDSTTLYNLPDSIKAVLFMAEVKVLATSDKKEVYTGIQTDIVKLSIEAEKKEKGFVFEFPKSAIVMARGLNTDVQEKGEVSFKYNWTVNEEYRLLIAQASDSAGNFSLFTGYVFLPKVNKWKLIGTCKVNGRWNSLQQPTSFFSTKKKSGFQTSFNQLWIQRSNGKWHNLKESNLQPPVINLMSHTDSIQQKEIELKLITDAILAGKTDAINNEQSVYYSIMKEGTGRQVLLTDTVTVFYKGYIFADNSIFDQTKDKPATFPLNRLIKGWQIGIPLCKVGGKIKLVIPSDLAYSIRTRSAKIPPNSILVFEIEVVDVK